MDLWDLTKLLFRRWYVAAPLLALSVAAVLLFSQSVRPDYKASGHVLLIPPTTVSSSGADSKVKNPWFDLGYGALGQAAILKVRTVTVLENLKASGYSDNVTITIDSHTPLLSIEAVGTSAEQATGTVRQIMNLLAEAVAAAQRQYGVTQNNTITVLELDTGDEITVITSKAKRVLIVALGVGLLFTTAATIGVDALLRRRVRRRSGADAVDGSARPSSRSSVTQRAADVLEPVAVEALRHKVGGPESVVTGDTRSEVSRSVALANSAGSNGSTLPDADAKSDIGSGPPVAQQSLNVEYTYDSSGSRPEGAGVDHDEAHVPGGDERSTVPPDATIVLPLSRLHWAGRDDEGKRR